MINAGGASRPRILCQNIARQSAQQLATGLIAEANGLLRIAGRSDLESFGAVETQNLAAKIQAS